MSLLTTILHGSTITVATTANAETACTSVTASNPSHNRTNILEVMRAGSVSNLREN
jgi:hypothetical protein